MRGERNGSSRSYEARGKNQPGPFMEDWVTARLKKGKTGGLREGEITSGFSVQSLLCQLRTTFEVHRQP